MAEEKIPRQVEDADVRAHDISAQEAFIHSCVDGVLNVDDIADVTVSSPAQVIESLERLGATDEARHRGCSLLEGASLPGDRETKNLYERAGIKARLITVSTEI